MEEMKVRAVYDSDTRRTHRYLVKGEEVQGALYVSKGVKKIPKVLVVQMVVGERE